MMTRTYGTRVLFYLQPNPVTKQLKLGLGEEAGRDGGHPGTCKPISLQKGGEIMVVKRLTWAGHSLVSLYGEGAVGDPPETQLAYVLEHLDDDLRGIGLSLENAVRHRLWTRDRSEEHTSELQSLMRTSYA